MKIFEEYVQVPKETNKRTSGRPIPQDLYKKMKNLTDSLQKTNGPILELFRPTLRQFRAKIFFWPKPTHSIFEYLGPYILYLTKIKKTDGNILKIRSDWSFALNLG